jgi:hypothetical protein
MLTVLGYIAITVFGSFRCGKLSLEGYNRLYCTFRGRKEEVSWSEGSLGYEGDGDSNKSVDQPALAVRGYAQNAGREREFKQLCSKRSLVS